MKHLTCQMLFISSTWLNRHLLDIGGCSLRQLSSYSSGIVGHLIVSCLTNISHERLEVRRVDSIG